MRLSRNTIVTPIPGSEKTLLVQPLSGEVALLEGEESGGGAGGQVSGGGGAAGQSAGTTGVSNGGNTGETTANGTGGANPGHTNATSGCSCRVVGSPRRDLGGLALGALGLMALALARRRHG